MVKGQNSPYPSPAKASLTFKTERAEFSREVLLFIFLAVDIVPFQKHQPYSLILYDQNKLILFDESTPLPHQIHTIDHFLGPAPPETDLVLARLSPFPCLIV